MASSEGIRQRKKDTWDEREGAGTAETKEKIPRKPDEEKVEELQTGSYWLTRIVFLRSLAFIYFVAFLVAANQNKQLLGQTGLLPTQAYLQRIQKHFHDNYEAFNAAPTLFWFADWSNLNQLFDVVAWSGMILSAFIFITGASNMIIMFTLWILYHTLVNVGQKWYSFGWESQLLETGFLAMFMCPVISLKQVPVRTPTPWVVVWGYRWLIFRIMIGAGLIKIRGDKCWLDLTCMNYHYQTQPVPNPVSYYLHQTPEAMHKFETSVNHFVELVAPFFLLLTRGFRIWGGAIQILFQVVLIISGNLSFLNWLTILPSIMCFDDASLGWLFGKKSSAKMAVLKIQQDEKLGKEPEFTLGASIRRVSNVMLALGLAYLSIPVVQNLLSSRQAMNTSFDSLRIVNTYGAFGSITKERTEVIFQGTRNHSIIPDEDGGIWEEYEFKCKPGNIMRRPCIISPYHYRLDWLMWFAAFQNYNNNPWLVHLAAKLLANDEEVTSLIAENPFQNGTPPRYIRAEHYHYEFTKIGSKEARRGQWWKRRKIGSYLPIIRLQDLKEFMRQFGWKIPKVKNKM